MLYATALLAAVSDHPISSVQSLLATWLPFLAHFLA